MFNRVFLFVVAIVSIVWIAYVGYDLLDQRDNLTPQNIFGAKDGEILVINRGGEVDLAELSFHATGKLEAFLPQLISGSYPDERIYISGKRSVIVIESPALWDKDRVERFFRSKNIPVTVSGDGELKFGNGLRGKYKRNNMLISDREITHAGGHDEWPSWDKKASASLIRLNRPLRATDVYFKTDGTISYQTKYNKMFTGKKVDDQDVFAQTLPGKLSDYHFYEREFSESIRKIDEKSPLFQWSETGYVQFNYEGVPCIVSDYVGSQDPFIVLQEKAEDDDESEQAGYFRNVQLTTSFPASVPDGFYIMYLADKVVLSEKKEVCEKIVADYQLGKTVALTKDVQERIYRKLPRKVSERFVSRTLTYTQSAYRNILIKTQISRKTMEEEQQDQEPEHEPEENWTQSVDGEIVSLFGRRSQQFIWTSNGTLISVSGKKLLWKMPFEGKMIGDPQEIDILDNGNRQILFNTGSYIYLVDRNGEPVNGFPVRLDDEAVNPVCYYRWKGVGNFLVADKKGRLVHFDNNGRELSSMKLSVSNCKHPVDVFNQKGTLVAVACGDNGTQTINLAKHKGMKTHPAIPDKRVVLKGSDGPVYYVFNRGELQRQDYSGNRITLANYPNPSQVTVSEGDNFTYIVFNSYNKIHILNERGIKMAQIDIPFRELASFDVITLTNGKTYIALVDAIENNLYLYDASGKCLTQKPLEGKGIVLLSERKDNDLVITTAGSGFVVQYFETLNGK